MQLNERWPTQRQSLTATVWRNNETALTDSPSKTRSWNINRKVSCQSDSRIRTNCFIYIYICMLTIDYRSYCQVYVFVIWTVILSFSSVYFIPVSTWFSIGSIGFWIWPHYIVTRTHRLYHMCICGIYAYVYIHIYVCVCVCVCVYIYIYVCAVIPHTALLSHLKLPQGKFLHRDSPSNK